jgi:DNA-binding NarL/FixJ family response regulator
VLLYGNLKDSFISPDVESIGKDFIVAYGISSREQEVILELIRGTSYKNIAKKLFISLSTVKSHVSNIYQKTETNNKIELIRVLKRYS